MNIRFVGIAGGSGAGKSTVSFALMNRQPESIGLIHFDDYQKKRGEVPLLGHLPNWDHPDAIAIDQLLADLESLKRGKPVEVMTKNPRDNPDYEKIGRVPITVQPKPVMIVEGYLALWFPELRRLYSSSFFLDAPHATRIKRRTKFVNQPYLDNVLIPMHEKYVEPTRDLAEHVIEIGRRPAEEVVQELERLVGF